MIDPSTIVEDCSSVCYAHPPSPLERARRVQKTLPHCTGMAQEEAQGRVRTRGREREPKDKPPQEGRKRCLR